MQIQRTVRQLFLNKWFQSVCCKSSTLLENDANNFTANQLTHQWCNDVFGVSLMIGITLVVDKTVNRKLTEVSWSFKWKNKFPLATLSLPFLPSETAMDCPSSLFHVIEIVLNSFKTRGLSCYAKYVWITERPKVNFCGRYVSFDQHQAINNNVIIELVGTRTWAYENIVKNRSSHK